MEFVIVLGLLRFPIALSISRLFEVTPAGLMLDESVDSQDIAAREPKPRMRFDQAIDCSLLVVALATGSHLGPSGTSPKLMASPIRVEQMLVKPFSVIADSKADAFYGALQIELQHELTRLNAVRVVEPRDPMAIATGLSMTRTIAILEGDIQTTVLLIDNRSGEVTWPEILPFPAGEYGGTPRDVAEGIVNALEVWSAEIQMRNKTMFDQRPDPRHIIWRGRLCWLEADLLCVVFLERAF